jgi:hypothetical protein
VHPAASRIMALTGSWASAWITTWTWLELTHYPSTGTPWRPAPSRSHFL